MKKKISARILASIQTGRASAGPGPIQPPRNNAAAMPETTNISRYSARRNEPKRMPPYSVL